MDTKSVVLWMQVELEKCDCLYQDDVVDFLVKSKEESFLRENTDGNQVLNLTLLNEFKKLTKSNAK